MIWYPRSRSNGEVVDVDAERGLEVRFEPAERQSLEAVAEPIEQGADVGRLVEIAMANAGLEERRHALGDRVPDQRHHPPGRARTARAIEDALGVPDAPGPARPAVLILLVLEERAVEIVHLEDRSDLGVAQAGGDAGRARLRHREHDDGCAALSPLRYAVSRLCELVARAERLDQSSSTSDVELASMRQYLMYTFTTSSGSPPSTIRP